MKMITGVNKLGRSVIVGDIVKAGCIGGVSLPDGGLYRVVAPRASAGHSCEYLPFEPVKGWSVYNKPCQPVIIRVHNGRFILSARLTDIGELMMRDPNARRLVIAGIDVRFNTAATWGNKQPVPQAHWAKSIDVVQID